MRISSKPDFVPKLLINRLASCFFSYLDFLLSHTEHLDETIVLYFLSLQLLGIYFLYIFFISGNTMTLFLNIVLTYNKSLSYSLSTVLNFLRPQSIQQD